MNQYILVSQPRLIGTGYRHRVAFDCRGAADAFAEQMALLRPGRAYWIEDVEDGEQRAREIYAAWKRDEVETEPWEMVKQGLRDRGPIDEEGQTR